MLDPITYFLGYGLGVAITYLDVPSRESKKEKAIETWKHIDSICEKTGYQPQTLLLMLCAVWPLVWLTFIYGLIFGEGEND